MGQTNTYHFHDFYVWVLGNCYLYVQNTEAFTLTITLYKFRNYGSQALEMVGNCGADSDGYL